jgi:hypothetical protein
MALITEDHAEWAVVDRMRQMMEEPKGDYLATQTYAMFTAILCWVMQHLRIPVGQQANAKDHAAANLLKELEAAKASDAPWSIPVAPKERTERVGTAQVHISAPSGFADHSVKRFLINLRNAMAHGDARNVKPFNSGPYLVGFTFNCEEADRRGRITWNGEITLLRSDMRRIGELLATRYRDAISIAGKVKHGPHFPGEGESILEGPDETTSMPLEQVNS